MIHGGIDGNTRLIGAPTIIVLIQFFNVYKMLSNTTAYQAVFVEIAVERTSVSPTTC